MTKTTAARSGRRSARTARRLAARHLVEQGMVLLDRNWRCEAGEIDLVLRDGDVLVVCEVKTRSSVRYGTPHEAVTDIKLARLHRLAVRWVEERGVAVRDIRIDLVGVVRPRRGRLAGRPRAGDRLMPFATAHTVSLHGAVGHLIDVQTDVSPGPGRRRRWSAGPTRRSTRPATGAGWRSSTATSTGRPPGGSRSCSRRPTCSSAAPTSTSRSRSRCSAAAGTVPAGSLERDRLHRRAHPRRRPALGPRRAADGAGRRGARDPARCSCPSPRRARRRWCPA